MQTCASFLGEMGGSIFFTPLEGMTLLVAALLHDLDHPGTNNLYQVNAGTELAIMYNDQAVRPCMHLFFTFLLFYPIHSSPCFLRQLLPSYSNNKLFTILLLCYTTPYHYTKQIT